MRKRGELFRLQRNPFLPGVQLVAGSIHQSGERGFAIGRLKSGCVPQLSWRFLSAEEEFGGYNVLEFVSTQYMLRRILCQTDAQNYGYESSNCRYFDVLHVFVLD